MDRRKSTRRKGNIYGEKISAGNSYGGRGSDEEDEVEPRPRRSCRGAEKAALGEAISSRNSGTNQRGGQAQRFKWSGQSEEVVKRLALLFGGDGDQDEYGGDLRLTTDVTLVSSEGDFVEGHKVVLALCSNYFCKLFSKLSRKLNKEPLVVVLSNVGTKNLRNLLRFMYTGEVDVAVEDKEEFLRAGGFLGLSGIQSTGSQSSFGVQDKRKKEDVIKVHVKRVSSVSSSAEDTQTGGSNEHVSCKVEPPEEEEHSNYLEDDSMDYAGGDGGDDGDWGGSNFSDSNDLTTQKKPSSEKTSNKSQQEKDDDEPRIDPKTGKLKARWFAIDIPSESDVAENWRLNKHSTGLYGYEAWAYYCAHGYRRCPAAIKKVLDDGEITWYTNQLEHSNHREQNRGIPPETKRFVVSMLEQGIRRPQKIFKAMRLLQMDLPTRAQLQNFIHVQVKKRRGEFPFPQRKEPPRIRKYVPKPGQPEKRKGRPPLENPLRPRPRSKETGGQGDTNRNSGREEASTSSTASNNLPQQNQVHRNPNSSNFPESVQNAPLPLQLFGQPQQQHHHHGQNTESDLKLMPNYSSGGHCQ